MIGGALPFRCAAADDRCLSFGSIRPIHASHIFKRREHAAGGLFQHPVRLDTTKSSAKEAARKLVNLVTRKKIFSCE